eukprot:Plantae.Rhodophyta-Purpureofilum_apyrenoidigerum.ctg2853.p1 GENE.Plantae.Rhodophyta-Purpureofilum_apyrenoidigerum.ctg2853~~Plantae.Rhodophyta-Purpureofilum_apyrenoidigerum.ctg2853.p1  ORF type:complete len:296 (+),score=49.56 Plantae.Rhodophyta-Purpureofilum_apyrenoidigerum.ctg2853:271-1158(+)
MMRSVGFLVSGAPAVGTSSFTAARCGTVRRRWAVTPQLEGHRRIIAPSMRTQQDTSWNRLKIVENSEACEEHRYIVIKVGITDSTGSLCDAYRTPGMFVQIRKPDMEKPGFFAISCAPNIQGYFEFLVKETPGSAWFTELKEDDEIEMSPVQGKGFQTSQKLQNCKDIMLFATGSGIAPIRAAIESFLNGVNPVKRRSVKLYYGCRYPERMAYKDRFKLWRSDGVEVIPVMSQPDKGTEEWTGRTGYVQDALKEDGVPDPSSTGVLLCGVKGMVEDVKAYLTSQGVPEDQILLNF